jgi:signal transduction histidine kinase
VLYLRKSDALAIAQAAQKADLQAANDRLEAEVSQRTLQLTQLTRHLLSAREDERHRLARNLHDDLGSLLTAAKLDAARIRSRLGAEAPEAQARLADLVDKLNSSIALGRSIIEDLRPSTLDHLGLAATLEILAADFTHRTGVPVHCSVAPLRLGPGVELVAYRVVQEALTNLSKYAHAKQVWITLAPAVGQPGAMAVSVRDDGVGFAVDAARSSAFGLLGMRFRVEAEGGSLRVTSQVGVGTQIDVTLPAVPQDT